jgi:hypothetical protein
MAHKCYILKPVFMYDNYIKSKQKIPASNSGCYRYPRKWYSCNRITGSLLNTKEAKHNANFSLERNWLKMLLGLNIPLDNCLHALHSTPGFEDSSLLRFWRGTSVRGCEIATEQLRTRETDMCHLIQQTVIVRCAQVSVNTWNPCLTSWFRCCKPLRYVRR